MRHVGFKFSKARHTGLLARVNVASTASNVSHLKRMTNLISGGSVCADDADAASFSTLMGAWSCIGPSVRSTTAIVPPKPGPDLSDHCAKLLDGSCVNDANNRVGMPETVHQWQVTWAGMSISVCVQADSALYRSGGFLKDEDVIDFLACDWPYRAGNVWADGSGNLKTDTGISYVLNTWQRWESTDKVGCTSYLVRVGNADTAFAYRDDTLNKVIVGVSPDAVDASATSALCKNYWQDLHPHGAGGADVNFMMDGGAGRVAASYRVNFSRLQAVKRRYDPGNAFRVNQNIGPG